MSVLGVYSSKRIAAGLALGLFLITWILPSSAEESYLQVMVATTPKTTAKALQARVAIDAPIDLVWHTMTRYEDMKNIIPGYEKSTVLKSNGASKLLDIAMKVAAFLPTYKYQVQARENQAQYQLNLERVSGDFRMFKATYKLTSEGNKRTIVTYNLNIDTGKPIPGSQAVLKANAERSLRALERHVEQLHRQGEIGQR